MTGFLAAIWLVGIAVACVVGLLIYFTVWPKNRLRTRLKGSRVVRKINRFFQISYALLVVGLIIVLGLNYYITESAWMPRTREVQVAAKAYTWVTGELKTCYSFSTPEKKGLTVLVCDPSAEETHLLNVKFWGTITTEIDKTWKCEREEASLTCKLQ